MTDFTVYSTVLYRALKFYVAQIVGLKFRVLHNFVGQILQFKFYVIQSVTYS